MDFSKLIQDDMTADRAQEFIPSLSPCPCLADIIREVGRRTVDGAFPLGPLNSLRFRTMEPLPANGRHDPR